VLYHIGHRESLLKDGVHNDFVITGPWLAKAEEFAVLRLLIRAKLSIKIFADRAIIEGFTEEDELQVLIKAESEVWIAGFDGSDLSDEFFNKDWKGEFVSNGNAVLSRN